MSPKTQSVEELVGLILREQELQLQEVKSPAQAACCLGQSRALPPLCWVSGHCLSQTGLHSGTVLGGLHVEDEVRAANPCGISSEPLRTTAGLHCQSEPDYSPRSLAATSPSWSLGNNFLRDRTLTPPKEKPVPNEKAAPTRPRRTSQPGGLPRCKSVS